MQVCFTPLSTTFVQYMALTPFDPDDDDDDGYLRLSVPATPSCRQNRAQRTSRWTPRSSNSPLACHANHHPLSRSYARLGRNPLSLDRYRCDELEGRRGVGCTLQHLLNGIASEHLAVPARFLHAPREPFLSSLLLGFLVLQTLTNNM